MKGLLGPPSLLLGTSLPVTAAQYFRWRLNRVACEAGLGEFYPLQFQHTLAIELPQADATMLNVPVLPEHSRLTITENHSA